LLLCKCFDQLSSSLSVNFLKILDDQAPHGQASKDLGDYSIGVPPLPIPNREVKPNSADGTASSGRVGRRQLSIPVLLPKDRDFVFVSSFIFSIAYLIALLH
jgi:hypothetical protein